jgi:hypothetical protein
MCMNSYNALGYGYYMYNLLKTTYVFVCFLWQFLARKAVIESKESNFTFILVQSPSYSMKTMLFNVNYNVVQECI